MSEYTYGALTNVGICSAIAVAIFVTGSAWPLIGLIFLLARRSDDKKDDSV